MTYPSFPSIPRLHRHFTVTEKIDGTSGIIAIWGRNDPEAMVDKRTGEPIGGVPILQVYNEPSAPFLRDIKTSWGIAAGSRNRWLTTEKGNDNHGFAAWVKDNAETLIADLGPGLHYGEWWGSGIGRGYGLPKGEKRFSLFNTKRWSENGMSKSTFETTGLGVVPVLFDSESSGDYGVTRALNYEVDLALMDLEREGSLASPGFMRPEGIIVYHKASGQYFKATIQHDDIPKSVAAKQREQKVSA